MSKPVTFKPIDKDIPLDQLLLMKDYIIAVRFFSDESIPSYSDLLITSDEFDSLSPDFVNQVTRLNNGGFLSREIQLYSSKNHEEPFCRISPSPSFLARLDYNVFEGSKEA